MAVLARPSVRRVGVVALLLVAGTLAGCFGGDDGPKAAGPGGDTIAERPDDVVVTNSTGAIQGLVTSDLFEPLVGAIVALLETAQETRVAKNGEFVINNVPEGLFRLMVAAPGYVEKVQNVRVAAGELTELRIQLTPLPSNDPYTEFFEHKGLFGQNFRIEFTPTAPCGTFPSYCANSGVGGSGTSLIVNASAEDIGTQVVEMVWASTSELGKHLRLNYRCLPANLDCEFTAPGTTSPLIVRVDPAAQAPEGNVTGWYGNWEMRAAPGVGLLGTGGSGFDLGVAYQQSFTIYFSIFHKQTAPEGYSGIPDS